MNLRTFYDRVIIRFPEKRQKSEGGIVIPDNARDPDQDWVCEVVAIGPGYLAPDGSRAPMQLKVGDKVLWKKGGGGVGTKFEMGGWDYLWTPESQILALVEQE